MILKSDTDILKATGIDQHVCFKYDDIYFPFIVVWYSTQYHKNYYQLFYDRNSAILFSNTLMNRGKYTMAFAWDTNDLAYNSI